MDTDPDSFDFSYEEVGAIGSGCFSQVTRVKDAPFAIKIPFPDAVKHLEREKLIYERLKDHPNILRYYGEAHVTSALGTSRGLLLRYHPQGTLITVLQGGGPPHDEEQRRKWIMQAIEAVRHVHSQKVIHGDLGSHNFLVKDDGSLALADFGGSRVMGDDDLEVLEFPPARYSRPRTTKWHGPLEMKDDLFGLGTVLYEISTGEQPYKDLDGIHVRARFAEREFPSLEGVPEGLRGVIVRCWTGGFESAEEIASAVRVGDGLDS